MIIQLKQKGQLIVSSIFQDIKYSFKKLFKNPLYTSLVLLTLALGIGANTAIFSIIEGVLLRPLSFDKPEQLFSIREVVPSVQHIYPTLAVNSRHLSIWAQQSKSIESMAAIRPSKVVLGGNRESEQILGWNVSWNIFHVLGVRIKNGRSFFREEDQPNVGKVVVVTESFRKRLFGSKSSALGKSITLDGSPYVVIGELPIEFIPPNIETLGIKGIPEVYKPIAINPESASWMGDFFYAVIARSHKGGSTEQITTELNQAQKQVSSYLPNKAELRVSVKPLQESIVGSSRTGLIMLFGAVGIILLIVCLNLAGLSLIRATRQRNETAIKIALGANRFRLIRLTMIESLILSISGGIIGLVPAFLAIQLLINLAPINFPRLAEVELNFPTLLFSFIVAVLVGMIFAILPALKLAGTHPIEALKSNTKMAGGKHVGRVRVALVVLQIALSLILVSTSILLMVSLSKVLQIDKGFNEDNILTVNLALPSSIYKKEPDIDNFFKRTLESIGAIPGISSASLINIPLLDSQRLTDSITLEGDRRPVEERPKAHYRYVSPAYFNTIGVKLKAGRLFEELDRSLATAIISVSTAEQIWPGENPIGKKFRREKDSETRMEVIGIVRDLHIAKLEEKPGLVVYGPYWQRLRTSNTLVVKTNVFPKSITPAITKAIHQIDNRVSLSETRAMSDVMNEATAYRRFQVRLVSVFAFAALILSVIGIYGITSESVSQRSKEIGIRMAIGATSIQIFRVSMFKTLVFVGIGLLVGIGGSLSLGIVMRSLLFEINATNPLILFTSTLVLLITATLAALVPAWRASKLNPVSILRCD